MKRAATLELEIDFLEEHWKASNGVLDLQEEPAPAWFNECKNETLRRLECSRSLVGELFPELLAYHARSLDLAVFFENPERLQEMDKSLPLPLRSTSWSAEEWEPFLFAREVVGRYKQAAAIMQANGWEWDFRERMLVRGRQGHRGQFFFNYVIGELYDKWQPLFARKTGNLKANCIELRRIFEHHLSPFFSWEQLDSREKDPHTHVTLPLCKAINNHVAKKKNAAHIIASRPTA